MTPDGPGLVQALIEPLAVALVLAVVALLVALRVRRRRYLVGVLAALVGDVLWQAGQVVFLQLTRPPMPKAKTVMGTVSLVSGQHFAPTWGETGTRMLWTLPFALVAGLLGVGVAWLVLRRSKDEPTSAPLAAVDHDRPPAE